MVAEERGDFRYEVLIEQPHGWIPAWPQSEFETDSGAVLLAQGLRTDGEIVKIDKYHAATNMHVGQVSF
ncbi:hypothetical protein LMG26857_03525 [Achromobacter anxifer]|uniref:hypothetical protein n=1 Tax=Achromobacter anxifer TaxID=1287737 RepID=UPI00155B49AF|nr:hypothetical protein [Achromobacter anxifer]CAB5514466.1 hypothetical protein LMG26857_03525 [Achromobacter anxifer]